MKPETLTALQGSIKKWEEIVAGTGADRLYANCPLCQHFKGVAECYDFYEEERCPVYESTGEPGCTASPYMAWWEATGKPHTERRATTPELVALAQAELDFLRGLLPPLNQRSGSET